MKTIGIRGWAIMRYTYNKHFKEGDLVFVSGVRADDSYDDGIAFRVENEFDRRVYLCSGWIQFNDVPKKTITEIPQNAIRKLCKKIQSLLLSRFKKNI